MQPLLRPTAVSASTARRPIDVNFVDHEEHRTAVVVAVVGILHVHHLRLRDVEEHRDVRLGQAFVPAVAQDQHRLALVAVVEELAHRESRALGTDVAPRERELRQNRVLLTF